MMHIKKQFILFAFVLLTTSCKDYLNTKPYSFNTTESLYASPEDAEIGLTGCYSILNAQNVQGAGFGETFAVKIPIIFNAGTDELVTQNGFTDPNYAPFGTIQVSQQDETLRNNWFFLYAGINRVNYLLDNIDQAGIPSPRLEEMIGEAKFLRALFYFYLAMEYGGVPVYTTATHDEHTQRNTLQEVFELILDDFTYAFQNLPQRAAKDGRANKWSAAGFLAKVYTYLASCKKNLVGEDLAFPLNSFQWVEVDAYYQEASKYLTAIINNGDYILTDHYDYLFRETTKSAQADETLFKITAQLNSPNGNYNLWLFWQIPIGSAVAGGGYGWFRPTGELFYKYTAEDGRRKHNLTLEVTPDGESEMIEGTNYFVPKECIDPENGNYCVGKFRYRDPAVKTISLGQAWSDGDIPVLRYADILLLQAEVLYQKGDETGARAMLSTVRDRSADGDVQVLNKAYHQTDFVDELLDERSRELCFEGWRRMDLIRFGRYQQAIEKLTNDKGRWNVIVPQLKENIKPFKVWFPIPITEIELSPLQQNPGY